MENSNPGGPRACTTEENNLNRQILQQTMMIRENYHELTKFISEMPVTVPCEGDPEINIKQLKEYLESLQSLVENYHKEKGGTSKLYEQGK
jgi:hypothetical protein